MPTVSAFIRNPDTGGLWTVATLPSAALYPPGTSFMTSDQGLMVSNGESWVGTAGNDAPYAAGNTSTAPVPNLANGSNQAWTQNGSVTWGAPTNPGYVGQTLTLFITKDATATSYTTAFNAIYRNAPTIGANTTASSKATFEFVWDGVSWQYIGGSTAFA